MNDGANVTMQLQVRHSRRRKCLRLSLLRQNCPRTFHRDITIRSRSCTRFWNEWRYQCGISFNVFSEIAKITTIRMIKCKFTLIDTLLGIHTYPACSELVITKSTYSKNYSQKRYTYTPTAYLKRQSVTWFIDQNIETSYIYGVVPMRKRLNAQNRTYFTHVIRVF